MKRVGLGTEEDMRLPPGRTCADCLRFRSCQAFGVADGDEITCDWAPSQFYPRVQKETS